MLQVSNLARRFGDDLIFEKASFVINEGERVGLVGPNGCGKTTLLRILVGEDEAHTGSVRCAVPRRSVGYLPQAAEYAEGVTVHDFLTGSQALDEDRLTARVQELAQQLSDAQGDELAALEEAYANRAELAQMEYQLDILERNISLSKSGDNPLISLIGSYQNTSDRFFDSEHYQGVFSATLNLSWPLWDNFATSGQVMAARAQMRQIEMGREQLEEGIILEVEALYRQMESSRQMMVAQEANIALAEEAVDMMDAQYKVGLATYLDVTDSQLTLRQAEIGYMQALHDYLLAVYKLYRAMGWEE